MRAQEIAAALVVSCVSLVFAANTTIMVTDDPASWQRQELAGVVGDTFNIILPAGNGHSLMQVSFDAPCTALKGGFNTGVSHDKPTEFILQLKTTDPIYIACGQPGHCHNAEGSTINAPVTTGTQSLVDFTLAARKTPEDNSALTQLNQSAVGSGVSASVVSIGEYVAPSATSTSTPTPKPQPATKGWDTWMVGVAVAVAVVLLAIGVGVLIFTRRRSAAREDELAMQEVVNGKKPVT
ncbi:hypothetical protein EXIGLDRAFT_838292 [Exidia glandulosa HHB12029]|uniref:Cupredoxin n=1 Tax=Exidia glandulosa HHB12029 TaxID=1314781 RepID=A0A165FZI1_EXIGL|nr:hypothetical protein EXIGLDRAFT_838292 [Exidia glandulosa HHB12029]